MSTIYDAQGGRARYIAEAVLFVDSDETWKVGEFGQTISSYKTISYGDTPLSDAIGFVALAVSRAMQVIPSTRCRAMAPVLFTVQPSTVTVFCRMNVSSVNST